MQLKEYLKKRNMTLTDFCKEASLSYHQVYAILRGCSGKPQTLLKIINASKGEITLEDLINTTIGGIR